jgi:hypothetical protein
MSKGKVEETPDEFDAQLHDQSRAGQHAGGATHETRPASDIKELKKQIARPTANDLKALPVLAPGQRLQQGAVYCNLNQLDLGEFRAMGAMEASDTDLFVAKSEVDFELWNKIVPGAAGTPGPRA